jgi:hypothetical protein
VRGIRAFAVVDRIDSDVEAAALAETGLLDSVDFQTESKISEWIFPRCHGFLLIDNSLAG